MMALSGDEIIVNRKRKNRLDVAAELTKAFARYNDGALGLQHNIEALKPGPRPSGNSFPGGPSRPCVSLVSAQDRHARS